MTPSQLETRLKVRLMSGFDTIADYPRAIPTDLLETEALEGDTKVGPAEPFTIASAGAPPKILKLPEPLVLEASSSVNLSLLYDLTGAVLVTTEPAGLTQFADGTVFNYQYFPVFALAGEVPRPEIYEIRVDDPQGWVTRGEQHWYFRMISFFDPVSGDLLGLQALDIKEAGDTSTDPAGTFVDTWGGYRRNPDGSYHLKGLNAMDPDQIPQWNVPTFRRGTHDGTLGYFMYRQSNQSNFMTEPASLSYHCTRIE